MTTAKLGPLARLPEQQRAQKAAPQFFSSHQKQFSARARTSPPEWKALRLRQIGSMAGTMPSRKPVDGKGAPRVLSFSVSSGKTRREPARGGSGRPQGRAPTGAEGMPPGGGPSLAASPQTRRAPRKRVVAGVSLKMSPPSQDAPGKAEGPAGATPSSSTAPSSRPCV